MKITSTSISDLFKSPVRIVERNSAFFTSEFHSHPEYELVYIQEGFGKRIIGNRIAEFKKGELVLIGPHVPHVWMSDKSFYIPDSAKRSKAIVVYFNPKIFSESFYEMEEAKQLNKLFTQSKFGIEIRRTIKKQTIIKLKKIITAQGMKKIILLLDMLNEISVKSEFNCINQQIVEKQLKVSDRLTDLFSYVNTNYKKHISLEEAAKITNLTPESFCRFFKQKTGKKFIEYLQETRVSHASQALLNTDLTIAEVAYKTGFSTVSNFNKLFKKITRQCPTQYRKAALER
jgi:AraC-like DNA-binding protein